MGQRKSSGGGARFWMNGRFLREGEAKISLLDRGLLFGDALYEVVRFYRRRCFLIERHLDRLYREAEEIVLPDPVGRPALEMAIRRLAAGGEEEDGLVLIHWTRGEGERRLSPPPGLSGNLFALRLPLPAIRARWRREGVPVITRPDRRWMGVDLKSTNLLASVLARTKAAEAGAHEALLYRGSGARARLTEGTSSSVFLVRGGTLVTPAARGLLPGITREVVLEVAARAGVPTEERTVLLTELRGADEAFLTATSSEILPIHSIDGEPVAAAPGPITRLLRDRFARFRTATLRRSDPPEGA